MWWSQGINTSGLRKWDRGKIKCEDIIFNSFYCSGNILKTMIYLHIKCLICKNFLSKEENINASIIIIPI